MSDFIPAPDPNTNDYKQMYPEFFSEGQKIKVVVEATAGDTVEGGLTAETTVLSPARGSYIAANISTNSAVNFDEYWFQTASLTDINNIKQNEFDGYFRNIDRAGFSSGTTNVTSWSTAAVSDIQTLITNGTFESNLDELMTNWTAHCINKVQSFVDQYPTDYQSKMYIVSDPEFPGLDSNWHAEFSRVRLRVKTNETYDAGNSVYFGDGSADSPKTLNAAGSYFLQ